MSNRRWHSLFLFDGIAYVPPYIAPSVTSFSLSYFFGSGPSASSGVFFIMASGLQPTSGNITVTPSTNVEVWDGAIWRAVAFTVAYTGGQLMTPAQYMVRLKAGLAVGNYSETVTFTGANAPAFAMPVSGSVLAVPTITLTPTTLPSFGQVPMNSYSTAQSYNLQGATLTTGILIVAPTGFIVNDDGSDTNMSPMFVAQSGGVINTTIYIKFNPTAHAAYSGNITHNSAGAVQKTMAVAGEGTNTAVHKTFDYYHYI